LGNHIVFCSLVYIIQQFRDSFKDIFRMFDHFVDLIHNIGTVLSDYVDKCTYGIVDVNCLCRTKPITNTNLISSKEVDSTKLLQGTLIKGSRTDVCY
jgi:hypothetical protein